MPSVGQARTIPAPRRADADLEESECTFIGPNREWTLRFFDPFEFAMGAYRWSTELQPRGAEARQLPEALDPERLQPWSPDSRSYAFCGGYDRDGATRLVPWEPAPYRKLRRDFWSLEVDAGTGALGSLLDRWHDFRYDADRLELSLGTYRPVSPPFSVRAEWGDEWVCRAEECWIALELAE